MKIEQKHFDAMMNGTKCKFWEGIHRDNKIMCLKSLNNEYDRKPFKGEDGTLYDNCEPLKTELYVKEWFEIAKQLHMGGYKIDGNDLCKYKTQTWYNDMWKTCGKKYYDYKHDFEYLPEWLEERES